MSDDIAWTPFMHGFVFWETPEPEHGPPSPEAAENLSEWLSGFRQAHADYPDVIPEPPDYEDTGETVAQALERLLPHHPALPTLRMMLRPM